MKKFTKIVSLFSLCLLVSCGAYFNQPLTTTKARIGENTSEESIIKNFPPKEKIIVGVYKFRDQTGQYKPVQNGSTFSTAVTQGGTAILLKSLEESGWFRIIERENIGNLLNERQIIRNTRQEYSNGKKVKMPALLFAGSIIEGGVVSYDSNIITGGSGLRYFGVGGSNQYRQDRITVYLRVISTKTGEVLKNVYVSKTILSQSISANLYRYVALRRLLEAETGVTKNEPAQLAVKEAIDKAVELLIVEGVIDGVWKPKGGKPAIDYIARRHTIEKSDAEKTLLYNRKQETRRSSWAIGAAGGLATINGDYANAVSQFNLDGSLKYTFQNQHFALKGTLSKFDIKNEGIYERSILGSSLNLEYNLLPLDRLSPFAYVGVGSTSSFKLNNLNFKVKYGLGLEYMFTNRIGFTVYGENNMMLNDKLDGQIVGNMNDQYWKFAGGLNFYF